MYMKEYLTTQKELCAKQITQLNEYIDTKQSVRDWHAIADAAMDIRDLEAKLEFIEDLISLGDTGELRYYEE